jgi:hypothetical protein
MQSVSQVETSLKTIMEEHAQVLARQTGCIQRKRKFNGADLLQTLVFGWLSHPDASLEMLASMAATREVSVTDTAIHQRFCKPCAQFLHAILEEMTSVMVHADQDVPIELLSRFSTVVLEDSSTVSLPNELLECWQGCGGYPGDGLAALKLHVRWELKQGCLWGPNLTNGRTSDRSSPFVEQELPAGSLMIQDLGYFAISRILQRRAAHSFTLTRAPAKTAYFNEQGKRFSIKDVLPQLVGQIKEMHVLVGVKYHYPMRLLMLRVPKDVAQKRRKNLKAEASRRGEPVCQQALELADWTILLTDVPAKRLHFEEALVLLRERWQMEILYKLWKQHGQIDEWRTGHGWRALCELYAKLIGMVLQHWLIVLFAWQDEQRSLVKLAQVVRDTCWTLMEALAGQRSLSCALQAIERRMRSGCRMNKRKKHPNSAQLLRDGLTTWLLSP